MVKVKIFPLPNLILNPLGKVTLNIFENRYKELVEDSLLDEEPVALATAYTSMEVEDFVRINNDKYPFIRPIIGYGEVKILHKTDEGNLLIMVTGQKKGRVKEVFQTKNYIQAIVEPIEENYTLLNESEFISKRLYRLLNEKLEPFLSSQKERDILIGALNGPEEMVAFYNENIVKAVATKIQILECNDLNDKLKILANYNVNRVD